jgi:hypothetical protein
MSLDEFIDEEEYDFLNCINDADGSVYYDGRLMSADEAIDAWTKNEAEKLSVRLHQALTETYQGWRDNNAENDEPEESEVK